MHIRSFMWFLKLRYIFIEEIVDEGKRYFILNFRSTFEIFYENYSLVGFIKSEINVEINDIISCINLLFEKNFFCDK